MDYGQIIKRSWEIVKKNKFLWWLGILAAFSSGFGGSSYNFSGLNGFSSSGGSSSTTSQSADFPKQLSDFFSSAHFPAIIAFVAITIVFMLVVYFVVLYFSIKAKAGLIVSVEKIENEGNAIGFRVAMREGGKYFWRLFGLGLLIGLVMMVLLLIFVAPLSLLFLSHSAIAIGTLILFCIVGIFALIIFGFIISLVLVFAQFMIVLDNKKVFESMHESYELLKRNVKEVLIGYAIAIGIGFIVGLAMIVPVIAVIIVGTLLGGLSYFVGGVIGAVIVVTILVFVGIAFFVVLGGFITAFTTTYWTLFYRALRYIDSQKTVSGVNNLSVPAPVN